MQMEKIIMWAVLILLTTQAAFAYELNGKKWAEDQALILLPKAFNEPLMRKRMNIIVNQFRRNVPFKIKTRYHDLKVDGLLNVINYATQNNLIIVLYKEGETYGLGNRVANASFVTANINGSNVHAGLIRINDIRLQQVIGGRDDGYALNYIANVTWHEVGHLFGLDHTDKRRGRPLMLSAGKFSKLKNLGLSLDDKKGLREIYK
jgi:hypothetical protein